LFAENPPENYTNGLLTEENKEYNINRKLFDRGEFAEQ